MVLHPAQIQIASDVHRFRVIDAGRRFGKTQLAVEEIKGKALAKESRIAYIAPTIQQARDIAWEILVKELAPIIIKTNESRLELRVRNLKGTESLIFLRGWEAVETLRGQHFDFLVIDEVASMRNFWLNWEEVLRPTLTDTRGEVMFISTPKGFNHFYDLYNKQAEDTDYKSFHFTSYHNPFIPADELDKMKIEMPEDRFAQEIMGDFRKMEGLVYKEFSRERHVYEHDLDPNQMADHVAGIDWGFTNPSCVLDIFVDRDSHFWIDSEYYKRGKTTAQIIEYVLALQAFKHYPDPAEPDRILELQNAGGNCQEVIKNIPAGIDAVRELFKQNRIHIHSSCINLINELETYRYPEKKPDKNDAEVPVKENDHAVDALRYPLYMLFGFKDAQTVSVAYFE